MNFDGRWICGLCRGGHEKCSVRSVTLQVRNTKIKADDAVRQEAEGKLDLHRRSAACSLDEQLTG